MTHKYNPTVTELRQAYEVAWGESSIYALYGAMFEHLDSDTIERLYGYALEKVKEDMEKEGAQVI